MPRPAPKCEPKLVSIEYCAEQCARWNPWAGSMDFFVGLESGIGVDGAKPDYAECLCDDLAHGPEAPQIMGGQPAPSAMSCPAKCPGAEPGGTDRCGGAPGTWALNIYRVSCGSAWGLSFLIVLAVISVGYVGGGIGWSVKVSGAAPGLQAHPHIAQWGQLQGLVQDGVLWTTTKLKQAVNGESSDASGGGLEAKLTDSPAAAQGVMKPATTGAISDPSSSEEDDQLVE